MAQARTIGPTTRVKPIANPVSCNIPAICAGAKSEWSRLRRTSNTETNIFIFVRLEVMSYVCWPAC